MGLGLVGMLPLNYPVPAPTTKREDLVTPQLPAVRHMTNLQMGIPPEYPQQLLSTSSGNNGQSLDVKFGKINRLIDCAINLDALHSFGCQPVSVFRYQGAPGMKAGLNLFIG